jgi:hypothetical protein
MLNRKTIEEIKAILIAFYKMHRGTRSGNACGDDASCACGDGDGYIPHR